jgi:hypothetical protein
MTVVFYQGSSWPSVTVLALVILFAMYAFIAAGPKAVRAFSSAKAGPVIGTCCSRWSTWPPGGRAGLAGPCGGEHADGEEPAAATLHPRAAGSRDQAGHKCASSNCADHWLCVPRTSSASCDQAIFVEYATGASVSLYAVLLKVDRFG